jgi:hypothetical protein
MNSAMRNIDNVYHNNGVYIMVLGESYSISWDSIDQCLVNRKLKCENNLIKYKLISI